MSFPITTLTMNSLLKSCLVLLTITYQLVLAEEDAKSVERVVHSRLVMVEPSDREMPLVTSNDVGPLTAILIVAARNKRDAEPEAADATTKTPGSEDSSEESGSSEGSGNGEGSSSSEEADNPNEDGTGVEPLAPSDPLPAPAEGIRRKRTLFMKKSHGGYYGGGYGGGNGGGYGGGYGGRHRGGHRGGYGGGYGGSYPVIAIPIPVVVGTGGGGCGYGGCGGGYGRQPYYGGGGGGGGGGYQPYQEPYYEGGGGGCSTCQGGIGGGSYSQSSSQASSSSSSW